MVNLVELAEAMKEKKCTKEFLAKSLGITSRSLTNKLNGTHEFKANEVGTIAKVLLLDNEQKNKIFFA